MTEQMTHETEPGSGPSRWRPRTAVAAVAVLAVTGLVTSLVAHGVGRGERTATLSTADGDGLTPLLGEPTPTPSAVTPQPTPSPTASATATDLGSPSPRESPSNDICDGPPPPDHPVIARCDALHPHAGLPSACLGLAYSCGYPDAWGAVTGGQRDCVLSTTGKTIHLSWQSDNLAGNRTMGPVRKFVIRLAGKGSQHVLQEQLLAPTQFSTTLTVVEPGSYDLYAYELNDSGLGGGCVFQTIKLTDQATPAPSPSDAGTPTPSPGAS